MEEKKFKVVERRGLNKIVRIFFTFFLSDTFNSLILLIKRNKRYVFDKKKYRGINLGSSTDNPPHWIGISGGITIFFLKMPSLVLRAAFPFSGRRKKISFSEFHQQVKKMGLIHHNLFYGIPFHDNSVSNIFSSHFFEHLTYDSARYLLSESYRVLEPGGKIRILVPSLNDAVERMTHAIESYYNGDSKPIQSFVTEPYQDFTDNYNHHRYMYNAESLTRIIEEAGFTEAKAMNEGEGLMPDLHLLEKRRSIRVEATKSF